MFNKSNYFCSDCQIWVKILNLGIIYDTGVSLFLPLTGYALLFRTELISPLMQMHSCFPDSISCEKDVLIPKVPFLSDSL